jgi:cytochrome c
MKFKANLIAASLISFSVAMLMPVQASAAVDADAAQALAKSNGCFKCHGIDKSKKGPAYQKVAAKYKGKPEGEQKIIDQVTKEPMAKDSDGKEEKHKVIDTTDPKQLKNLAQWILSL